MGIGASGPMRLTVHLGLLDGFVDAGSRECIGFFSGASLPAEVRNVDGAVLWLKEGDSCARLLKKTASLPVVIAEGPKPQAGSHIVRQFFTSLGEAFRIQAPDPLFAGFPDLRGMGRLAIIHPGSGSMQKNFEPELYRKVAEGLKQNGWPDVRLIMGPAEIERGLPRAFPDLGLIFPPDAVALAELLKTASLYIGNDSGVSHLAGYLGLPSYVLYKATDPAVWGVIGKNAHLVKAENSEAAFETLLRLGIGNPPL